MEKVSSRVSIGTVIKDAYEVTGVYGAGGFAVVYKAAQLNLGGRDVAIKVLNPVPEGEEGEIIIQRFLQEATAAASITHPNVVMIHDLGFLEGNRPYIVMQPFVGHDLQHELRKNGAMAPERFLPMFCDSLGALDDAHINGIIHRDLKPSNFVITKTGTKTGETLKLIDFGIARLMSEGLDLTRNARVIGTVRYLAPEYITSDIVSPSMDIYQCGLVLVEALTGQPVIQGKNSAQCLQMAISAQWQIPEALKNSALAEVIRKTITIKPAARYSSAGELREAIAAIDPSQLPRIAGYDNPQDTLTSGPHDIVARRDADEIATRALTNSSDVCFETPTRAEVRPPPPTPPEVKTERMKTTLHQPSRPRHGWALLGIGLLGLAILGLIAVIAGFSEPEGASAEPEKKPLAAIAPSTKTEPATGKPPGAKKPLTPEVIELPAARTVLLKVKPARAKIFSEDNELLGTGAAQLSFESKAAPTRELKIKSAGYSTLNLKVEADSDKEISVELKRRRPTREAKKSKSTEAPPAREQPPAETQKTPAETQKKPSGGFGIMK